MFTKQITFEDFNGEERTETFRFHISKSEWVKLEASVNGGFSESLKLIMEKKDGAKIMDTFEKLILKSYGEKSIDGTRFEKSEELSRKFFESPAYDILFMELVTDANAAANFVNNLIPEDVRNQMKETPATIAAKQ